MTRAPRLWCHVSKPSSAASAAVLLAAVRDEGLSIETDITGAEANPDAAHDPAIYERRLSEGRFDAIILLGDVLPMGLIERAAQLDIPVVLADADRPEGAACAGLCRGFWRSAYASCAPHSCDPRPAWVCLEHAARRAMTGSIQP